MKKIFWSVPLITLMLLSFISCSTKVMKNENGIYCDFFAARDLAIKQKKELLAVFTACGDDFDEGKSDKLVEEVLLNEEFKKTIGNEFIVVQCDLSQREYDKTVTTKDSTEKEIRQARKIRSVYDLNVLAVDFLNCHKAPSIFRFSDKGFFIDDIKISEEELTVEKITETIRSYDIITNTIEKELQSLVSGKDKKENVQKIIEYLEIIDPKYIKFLDYLYDYVLRYAEDTKSAFIEDYKKMKTERKATRLAYQNDFKAVSKVFYKLGQDTNVSNDLRCEAYFNASYFIGLSDKVNDYNLAIKYVEKAKELTTDEEKLSYYDELIAYCQKMQNRAKERKHEKKSEDNEKEPDDAESTESENFTEDVN